MTTTSSTDGTKEPRRSVVATVIWTRLMDVWISIVIALFFLIRVLGSHAAQVFFRGYIHPHRP